MTRIIFIIIVAVIVILLLKPRTRQQVAGICAAALGQDAKKRENKEKILAMLSEMGSASNSDIREALGVSERTAARYMDELEREGEAEQVGSAGRNVVYRLKRRVINPPGGWRV